MKIEDFQDHQKPEVFEMRKVPSVRELQKICFRTPPDIYRIISIYFTRWALIVGTRANTITVLRAILLLAGFLIFIFAQLNILWMIIGLIAFHLVVFLDTMDGAIARYNKEASFFGETLDFLLDHTSSTIIYFLSAGILCYRLGSSNLLLISIATIILAQFAAFIRALYTEHNINTEQLRQEQFLFSFFHQDNMRLLLFAFTLAAVYNFFNTQALPTLVVVYLEFIVLKILYLLILLWVLARRFPITMHFLKAYWFSFIYIILQNKKLKIKLQDYKDTMVAQAVLNILK